jgi:PEP-CTERM motif
MKGAMMKLKICFIGAALLSAVGINSGARAEPVALDYSDVVTFTTIAGTNIGDKVSFEIFANNGGTSLLSQTWSASEVTSATITIGSYSATLSGGLLGSFGSFETNAAGQLSVLSFSFEENGTSTNGSGSFVVFLNGSNEIFGTNPFGIDAFAPPTISNTSISAVSTVPEPSTWAMMILGFCGLGFMVYRKKTAARFA